MNYHINKLNLGSTSKVRDEDKKGRLTRSPNLCSGRKDSKRKKETKLRKVAAKKKRDRSPHNKDYRTPTKNRRRGKSKERSISKRKTGYFADQKHHQGGYLEDTTGSGSKQSFPHLSFTPGRVSKFIRRAMENKLKNQHLTVNMQKRLRYDNPELNSTKKRDKKELIVSHLIHENEGNSGLGHKEPMVSGCFKQKIYSLNKPDCETETKSKKQRDSNLSVSLNQYQKEVSEGEGGGGYEVKMAANFFGESEAVSGEIPQQRSLSTKSKGQKKKNEDESREIPQEVKLKRKESSPYEKSIREGFNQKEGESKKISVQNNQVFDFENRSSDKKSTIEDQRKKSERKERRSKKERKSKKNEPDSPMKRFKSKRRHQRKKIFETTESEVELKDERSKSFNKAHSSKSTKTITKRGSSRQRSKIRPKNQTTKFEEISGNLSPKRNSQGLTKADKRPSKAHNFIQDNYDEFALPDEGECISLQKKYSMHKIDHQSIAPITLSSYISSPQKIRKFVVDNSKMIKKGNKQRNMLEQGEFETSEYRSRENSTKRDLVEIPSPKLTSTRKPLAHISPPSELLAEDSVGRIKRKRRARSPLQTRFGDQVQSEQGYETDSLGRKILSTRMITKSEFESKTLQLKKRLDMNERGDEVGSINESSNQSLKNGKLTQPPSRTLILPLFYRINDRGLALTNLLCLFYSFVRLIKNENKMQP